MRTPPSPQPQFRALPIPMWVHFSGRGASIPMWQHSLTCSQPQNIHISWDWDRLFLETNIKLCQFSPWTYMVNEPSVCRQGEAYGSQSNVCECVCWAHSSVFSFPPTRLHDQLLRISIQHCFHPFQSSILPSLNEVKTGTRPLLYQMLPLMHKNPCKSHQRHRFDGVTLCLNQQSEWDAARFPPYSPHRPLPAWDPLCLQTWRRPKSGRTGWRGAAISRLMLLQLNSGSDTRFLSSFQLPSSC